MKIDVISFTDDGKLTLDLDEEAQQMLIEIAVNKILKDRIKHEKEKQDDDKKELRDEFKHHNPTCSTCGADLVCDEEGFTEIYSKTKHFTSDD